MSDFYSKESGQTDATVTSPASWDPYEVWRTRVLLPRLEDRLGTKSADDSQAKLDSDEEAPRLTGTG